ncbi:low-specificity L-threonine aldolase [Breznakiellaceae bacterium SP9]
MIDLRSDTVTKPTAEMRAAMAQAEVGDDVYQDDPSVNALQELAAQTLGKESALFVPSGTFGNQLALFTHAPRGSEVVLGEQCHIIQHEAGAASVIAGVQLRQIDAPDGALDAAHIAQRLRRADIHAPATSLICLENAHSNGKAVPLKVLQDIHVLAQAWSIPVHLDGARLFNAAAALNCGVKEIAAYADSVMFCISKGLCAPVGSLLAGTKRFVEAARFKRKIMGGGLRQAGILAAAGIIAIKSMTQRLEADHKRARALEAALTKIKGITVAPGNDINMVFFTVSSITGAAQAAAVVNEFRKRGIIISEPQDDGTFRFVTHYWIGDSELEQIITAAAALF